MAIDIKKLFPLIKRELPGVPDAEILSGMQEFTKAHPDLNNVDALAAFNEAMKDPQTRQSFESEKNKFSSVEQAISPKEVK